MKNNIVHSVHWSFWVIVPFMLIWNVMGCMNFIVQMNPDMVASYRETEQAINFGPAGMGNCRVCRRGVWRCAWVRSASVQKIRCRLPVCAFSSGCRCDNDPYIENRGRFRHW